jgi:hypothetical protein
MATNAEPWYAVRCVVRFPDRVDNRDHVYEERITLWRADSFGTAIERAENEAREYAATLDGENVELAQAYHLAVEGADVGDGAEVFSLMRDSELGPREYVDRYFDTGAEREGTVT